MAIRFALNKNGGKPKTFPFSQTFLSGAERTFTVKVNENAKKERTALDNIQFTYSGNTIGVSSILAIAQISSVVNGVATITVRMSHSTEGLPSSITGEVKTF